MNELMPSNTYLIAVQGKLDELGLYGGRVNALVVEELLHFLRYLHVLG